jgi:hypothetical protein
MEESIFEVSPLRFRYLGEHSFVQIFEMGTLHEEDYLREVVFYLCPFKIRRGMIYLLESFVSYSSIKSYIDLELRFIRGSDAQFFIFSVYRMFE